MVRQSLFKFFGPGKGETFTDDIPPRIIGFEGIALLGDTEHQELGDER